MGDAAVPQVLNAVPDIVGNIPNNLRDFAPQGISNCLWAAATLKEKAPEVLSVVPSLAARVSVNMVDMNVESLRMSAWAAEQLGQDDLWGRLGSRAFSTSGLKRPKA